jgi:hypothetical protein
MTFSSNRYFFFSYSSFDESRNGATEIIQKPRQLRKRYFSKAVAEEFGNFSKRRRNWHDACDIQSKSLEEATWRTARIKLDRREANNSHLHDGEAMPATFSTFGAGGPGQ